MALERDNVEVDDKVEIKVLTEQVEEPVESENEESYNIVEAEKKWLKVYKFLLEIEDAVPAYTLMHVLNMSRTEFYNAVKWLRLMNLVEIKLDANDMRKHLYKAREMKR